MTSPRPVAVILAAGKSTRMRSALPKPLHPVCGVPMTQHVIRACRAAGVEDVVVVIGHEAEQVRAGLGDGVEYAVQSDQRGTGHAVKCARDAVRDAAAPLLVLAGDTPLLRGEALRDLISKHASSGAAATLLTSRLDDPAGYGRVLRDADGHVTGIVEHRDATPEQRAITEWNPSIYVFDQPALWSALDRVTDNNAQGELYLTDAVGILAGDGRHVEALCALDAEDAAGVNTRVELAAVNARMQVRILERLMLSGCTVVDPASTWVDADVTVGEDSTLEPFTTLRGRTAVGERTTVGPAAHVRDAAIGSDCTVVASFVAEANVADGCRIGPFANLRPGTVLEAGVKIGDFVETKKATFGAGAQASHLAYVGDAVIGRDVNIGAGTITCNYDGYRKSVTRIGDGAFVGSNSTLVAPVEVGPGAFVAAGSVVTEDVEQDALALGRARQTAKPGWARRFRDAHASRNTGE